MQYKQCLMNHLISWHSLCITLTNRLKIRLHPVGLTTTGTNRRESKKNDHRKNEKSRAHNKLDHGICFDARHREFWPIR